MLRIPIWQMADLFLDAGLVMALGYLLNGPMGI